MGNPTSARRTVTSVVSMGTSPQGHRALITSRELVAMREEIVKPEHVTKDDGTASPEGIARSIHLALRHVNETTQSARSLPVLGGAYWPNVIFSAGALQQQFSHGVQGLVAFIVCRVRQSTAGPAPVIVEVGQDANGRITIAASVACIADLWFYPQPGPAIGQFGAPGASPPFPVPTPGSSLTWHSATFLAGNTWTSPVTGLVLADGWGGGGGGGGGGGSTTTFTTTPAQGGGGGGGSRRWTRLFAVTANVGYAVALGSAGFGGAGGAGAPAGNTGAAGGDGGDTSVVQGGVVLAYWRGGQGGGGGSPTACTTPVALGGTSDNAETTQFNGLSMAFQGPGYGGWVQVSPTSGRVTDAGNFAGGAPGSSGGAGGCGGGGGGAGPGAAGQGGGLGAGAGNPGGPGGGGTANTGEGGGGGAGGGSAGGGAGKNGGNGGPGGSGQVVFWWLQ